MAKHYEAVTDSWGFQGRYWRAGDIAVVSPAEEKDKSLVHFRLTQEDPAAPDVDPDNTLSGITNKAQQRPKTGMLAK